MLQHAKMYVELGELARRNDLAGGQERNLLHRATRNWSWISTVPHCLNGMEFLKRSSRIIFD